ncbi:hypothetical protein [Streptomyces lancefieldiae]|uniref:PASTA domain-containing protein n=1 Tax=Streptomyces lancefieldiae TaxID=3075520 RepID=A0ABU3AJ54_9ACTN|nr:hypothetical protein [Streptomyces sp. DSM 40712]MDT0610211.1 hypothetical protein [Streptomyces sp. DSM 40712]
MTTTRLLGPALVTALLASVTACGASSAPDDAPADAAPASASAGTPRAANHRPVTAGMPDVIGGNAGRAQEQMGSETDITFEDASGQGRPVDDPAEWKICASRPGPNQQITDYPVVFGVVKVAENCEDAPPE